MIDAKKFDHKAIRVMFFSYSTTQKGYKCLDPKTRKWYVYRDITFVKYMSFFLCIYPQGEIYYYNDEEYYKEQMV